jgi:Permeases of the drug/metabolite transporter (DMT) superfamily
MNSKELKSNILLLITAMIWGFAFVAQRIGAGYVGAFTFNGVRFALGAISLIPFLFFKRQVENKATKNHTYLAGIIAGCLLFTASSLQQIGLAETTAGKAAFITGFYIVIVPFLGIFLKHRINLLNWFGALLAIIGLYLLSVTESLTISRGDFLELIGAILFSFHILVIDHFTKRIDALKLSFVQFLTCSFLSIAAALMYEKITLNSLSMVIIPILYGGLGSVGIAYTLQAFGQKHTKASHAAIILSMESVFAAIGGLIILKETMGVRGYTGCALMLGGMLISQLRYE